MVHVIIHLSNPTECTTRENPKVYYGLWVMMWQCRVISWNQHTTLVGDVDNRKSYGGGTGEGDGTSFQYSCLENPMDGGFWWATVHGVAKSRTRLSDFTFTFHCHALEKEMATHSSILAWRIPGTGEPGGLPSMGLHRVGHNWSDLAAAAWRWDTSGSLLNLPVTLKLL